MPCESTGTSRADRARGVEFAPFARFPTWMWRNAEVDEFVTWLRQHNLSREKPERAGFYGLDLYSMFASIAHVLDYLNRVDPEAAKRARARYGALTPWQRDPAAYGQAVLTGAYQSWRAKWSRCCASCSPSASSTPARTRRTSSTRPRTPAWSPGAEPYYRTMYYGSAASWNLRDQHMFDTLLALLSHHGPESSAIVWEHNSHVGDARATEMSARGELNLGQLCRERFGAAAYIVGFGTDHGTVAAATDWGGPMETKRVRPARATATSGSVTSRTCARSCCTCVIRAGASCAPSSWTRGSSARSACLPPRDGARESLLPRDPADPVRRVRVVRRDACGHAPFWPDRPHPGSAGDLPLRAMSQSR